MLHSFLVLENYSGYPGVKIYIMKKIKVVCCQARGVFYSFQTALLNIMMRGNATSEIMYLKFLTELSVLYLECLFEDIWEKL